MKNQTGFEDSIFRRGEPHFELKFDAGEGPQVAILEGALYGRLNEMLALRIADRKTGANVCPPGIADSVAMAMLAEKNSKNGIIMKDAPLIREKENSAGLVHALAGTAIMMLSFSVTTKGTAMRDV